MQHVGVQAVEHDDPVEGAGALRVVPLPDDLAGRVELEQLRGLVAIGGTVAGPL
jgi:hypothetical protein